MIRTTTANPTEESSYFQENLEVDAVSVSKLNNDQRRSFEAIIFHHVSFDLIFISLDNIKI